jgi:hypothetical protein
VNASPSAVSFSNQHVEFGAILLTACAEAPAVSP